ncbi:ribonuclease Y [bacterium]|nr:ribonuclease Y [bacterium]
MWFLIISLILWVSLPIAIYYIYQKTIKRAKEKERKAEELLEEARKKADSLKREALLEAKEEAHRFKSEIEQSLHQQRRELNKRENRLLQEQERLERRIEALDRREKQIASRERLIEELQAKAEQLVKQQKEELERIANLSPEEAREIILKRTEEELAHEIAQKVAEEEKRIKEISEARAREIIAGAIQKCAVDMAQEITVTTVSLPSDDVKGKIIGREGRNIRTFESLTGVDLLIDDTPEVVVISSFDPVRREIARIALEKLIIDGRIHPAKIEEMVAKAKREVEDEIIRAGEEAMEKAKVMGLHPEMIRLLGRLKYRTSYGQNVLAHSLEVAFIAGQMAEELGVNANVARRAGLLHDIGKALDEEGSHTQLGAKVARRYGERDEVINAILSHHGEEEPRYIESVLVQAADTLSAARPGARREMLEAYLRRLEQLEKIVSSFPGIERSFAIQAGREVRVIVKPEEVDDAQAAVLARDIAKRIEQEMEYPGQIKVVVIREKRAIEYAK